MKSVTAAVGATLGAFALLLAACEFDGLLPFDIPAEVSIVRVSPGTATLGAVGDTLQLSVSAWDADGRRMDATGTVWSAPDPDVVSVSEAGNVTGKGPGQGRVLASFGGVTDTATFSVPKPPAEEGDEEEDNGDDAGNDVGDGDPGTVHAVVISPRGGTHQTVVGDPLRLFVSAYDSAGAELDASEAEWTSLNPEVAVIDSLGNVASLAAGTALITASLACCADTATVVVDHPEPPPSASAAGVAELPRITLNTTYFEPGGEVIRVSSGDDLQAALDAASPGNIVELEAGATWHMERALTLPDKGRSDDWIVIRSSRWRELPAEGERVTPDHAHLMPRIEGGMRNQRVLRTAAGASRYRMLGLEIAIADEVERMNAVVEFGHWQQTESEIPHDLILDRVYIHGHPGVSFQRCLALNSARSAVIDSWLGECHGRGVESQGIAGWAGPGPFKIVNNHITGSGINILIGGAVPDIDGLIPSDIEIRRNHLHKPPEWEGVWSVKNHFETKNAARVLFEGNVLENNWPDAQAGFSVLFKSEKSGSGSRGMWMVSEDITMRHNKILNTRFGLNVTGKASSAHEHSDQNSRRILVENNFWEADGSRAFMLQNAAEDLHIIGNTFTEGGLIESNPQVRLVMQRNVVGGWLNGSSVQPGLPVFEARAPDVKVGDNVWYNPLARHEYPPEDTTRDGDWSDYSGPSGVDWTTLEAATRGVVVERGQ